MFLFLVLTVLYLSLSAQSHIEITGTDTCAIIPIKQLRAVNAKFIELKECHEENDSLFSQIRDYEGITNNLRLSITDLRSANSLNQLIITDQKKIIDISDKELKKNVQRIKFLKIERNSLAGACLLLIGKLLVFN